MNAMNGVKIKCYMRGARKKAPITLRSRTLYFGWKRGARIMGNLYRTLMVHRHAYHVGDRVRVNQRYIGVIVCIKHNRVVTENKVIYFSELWDMEAWDDNKGAFTTI